MADICRNLKNSKECTCQPCWAKHSCPAQHRPAVYNLRLYISRFIRRVRIFHPVDSCVISSTRSKHCPKHLSAPAIILHTSFHHKHSVSRRPGHRRFRGWKAAHSLRYKRTAIDSQCCFTQRIGIFSYYQVLCDFLDSHKPLHKARPHIPSGRQPAWPGVFRAARF